MFNRMFSVLALSLFFTIPVAAQPQTAYITNIFDDDVTVIGTATNTPVAPDIQVLGEPEQVVISPDCLRAYVTNRSVDNVSVISTISNTVVGNPIPVGDNPDGICVTPNGSRLYVANLLSDNVTVIDATNNSVITTIPTGDGTIGVAVTPDGSTVYASNTGDDTVSVIDTATNTVTQTIPVGGEFPIALAVTPDGSRVYVTNQDTQNVSVINTATNTVITTITTNVMQGVSDGPRDVVINSDGSLAYVAVGGPSLVPGNASNFVVIIDTATNTLIGQPIDVGRDPDGMDLTPDGRHLYVTNAQDNNVSVIDTETNTVVDTFPVGDRPRNIAITQCVRANVPTLNEWGLITMAAVLGIVGFHGC